MTSKYLLENDPETIVYNTLSGYLIKFLSEHGPQPFEIIDKLATSQYGNLRKLSGHLYTGNVHKAVKGALTANGLFEEVTIQLTDQAKARKVSEDIDIEDRTIETPKPTIKWQVCEEAAKQYIQEKVQQVTEQQNKLLEKKKYKIQTTTFKDSEKSEISSTGKYSQQKSKIENKRDSKLQSKREIYTKLNKFVNSLDSEKEKEIVGTKSDTVKMMSRRLDKVMKSDKPISANQLPEQLMGAMQLYSFFRNTKDQGTIQALSLGLNQLSQSIQKLDAETRQNQDGNNCSS